MDILFFFEVIWKIDEEWLIDVSFSLAPRGTTRLPLTFLDIFF